VPSRRLPPRYRLLGLGERALALAPERPEGHLAMGDYHYRVSKQYARALEQYVLGQRSAPRNADLLVATGLTEQTLGRWEEALQHLQQAWTLDPRSVNTARRLSRALMWLRRYPEALRVTEQGLALAPESVELFEQKAMVSLAQGDLATARAVLRDVPADVSQAELVADRLVGVARVDRAVGPDVVLLGAELLAQRLLSGLHALVRRRHEDARALPAHREEQPFDPPIAKGFAGRHSFGRVDTNRVQ
jgi:tetratricopeptide (TPR) repeat protein